MRIQNHFPVNMTNYQLWVNIDGWVTVSRASFTHLPPTISSFKQILSETLYTRSGVTSNFWPSAGSQKWAPTSPSRPVWLENEPLPGLFLPPPQLRALRAHSYATVHTGPGANMLCYSLTYYHSRSMCCEKSFVVFMRS